MTSVLARGRQFIPSRFLRLSGRLLFRPIKAWTHKKNTTYICHRTRGFIHRNRDSPRLRYYHRKNGLPLFFFTVKSVVLVYPVRYQRAFGRKIAPLAYNHDKQLRSPSKRGGGGLPRYILGILFSNARMKLNLPRW